MGVGTKGATIGPWSDHAELVDCQDQAEFASQQANYDMEGMDREHQSALAAMTKDIDDLMTEAQEQTQAVLPTVNTQLRHETQCYHDECSAARALRSEFALLTANQTRPASPASNQFRSHFGTPPKSSAASVGLNAFGVIPSLPAFRRDESIAEAAFKISAAKYKMTKFLKSIIEAQATPSEPVGPPPLLPVAASGGGLSSAAAGGAGSTPRGLASWRR